MGGILECETSSFGELYLEPVSGDGQAVNAAIQAHLNAAKDAQAKASIMRVIKETGAMDPGRTDWTGGLKASLPEDLLPEALKLSRGDRMPDFCTGPAGFVVSAGFRDLVEALDGEAHQFFPVKVFDASGGRELEGKWFHLHTRLAKNSIITAGSNLKADTSAGDMIPEDQTYLSLPMAPEFTARKEVIGTSGIWRETRLPDRLFASDALLSALEDARLTGWATACRIGEV